MAQNLHDFTIQDIDGNRVMLDKFKGKPVLLVNTASRCGFTKQYANLSNLHREYLNKNLVIIGTPSNSFHQELSNEEEVKEFCLVNYDTKFIISEIIDVNGEDAHPLYSWMTSKYNETPKWNFYKYLFDGDGNLVGSWTSMTKPDSSKITKLIDKLI
tara:strand:- start:108 stop:578 length:471 start_codon:yes stop_codon:yes gene_type:complete